jgi:hypothetical protein
VRRRQRRGGSVIDRNGHHHHLGLPVDETAGMGGKTKRQTLDLKEGPLISATGGKEQGLIAHHAHTDETFPQNKVPVAAAARSTVTFSSPSAIPR